MPGTSNEDLGTHCFQYVRPEFREKASQGFNIVVAGAGFGSGSSREEAPRALLGCGIQAVVAKSYAYIYGRNQPNMALLGVIVKDEGFYNLAKEGSLVTLHLAERMISVSDNEGKDTPVVFSFELSRMEEAMIQGGGVTELYRSYGPSLFRAAIAQSAENTTAETGQGKNKKQKMCGTATGAEQEALSW
jgi:homoaconitate hydratase